MRCREDGERERETETKLECHRGKLSEKCSLANHKAEVQVPRYDWLHVVKTLGAWQVLVSVQVDKNHHPLFLSHPTAGHYHLILRVAEIVSTTRE